jgi:hypothetical protein
MEPKRKCREDQIGSTGESLVVNRGANSLSGIEWTGGRTFVIRISGFDDHIVPWPCHYRLDFICRLLIYRRGEIGKVEGL